MNRILLYLSFAAFTGTVMFASSCKEDKDPCEDVNCLNEGACDDGDCVCEEFFYGSTCAVRCVNGSYDSTCVCNSGWEGDECETEERAKFIGSFSVYETCITSSQDYNYLSTIKEGEDGLLSIAIYNFRDDETYAPVIATVEDGTNLLIEPQKPKGTQEVSGTGYINDTRDTITIDYEFKANSGSTKEICTLKFY